MSGRPKSPGLVPNKAREIRRVAKTIVSQGKPPRPKTIVEVLGSRGIRVTSAQVSMALRDTEFAYRRNDTEPRPMILPDPIAALKKIDVDDLPKAREFVRAMGSTERAIASIVAIGQFKEPEPQAEDYYGGA